MSGGVDSSVAAALMKKKGCDVVGVFIRPWQPTNSQIDCLWKQDREDALRVAAKMDIPLLTWDLSKEYEKRVAKYMIKGYQKGITPNPDVMCNKFIKFGVFLERALKMGADYIATGHYVRISKFKNQNAKLLKAKDKNKDQSYFLYTFTQEQLKHCLFPIGDWTKPEVRLMAKKFGLPNWDKKDSQGVCFVGPFEFSKFLKKQIEPKTGLVIRKSDGQILGNHDGVWFYTIGQRHGIRIAHYERAHPNEDSKPHYVVDKDVEKNVLYVDVRRAGVIQLAHSRPFQRGAPRSSAVLSSYARTKPKRPPNPLAEQLPRGLFQTLQVKDFNWINKEENLPFDCKVKTRYRQEDLDCVILKNGGSRAEIKIAAENILIAPGQSAVFYKDDEILGGGIIV